MRYKLLTGLAAGSLAAVGVVAPAYAISDTSSDVYVVHGIPGLTVDVYVNDALTLEDFDFGTVAGPLDLAQGDYKIQVFAANDDPATATPAIDVPAAAVPAGQSISLVAHYTADGDPTLGVFVNDISKVAAGEARITARHTAEAGPVAIVANGAIAFDNVSNGQQGSAVLPAGEITAGVAAPGTTSPIVIPTSGEAAALTLAEGTNTIVYAVGPEDDLQLITQSIGGLHTAPDGVRSGTAGLAADTDPSAAIGATVAGLALLALIGTVIVRARMSMVRAEN